jgi:holo-[acyl-carrier protein] synthase
LVYDVIHGIGNDLVFIPRIVNMLDRHGERLAQRILTENEMVGFTQAVNPAAFLAKRFAAKEATAKAFGTGFRDGLSLRHIEVSNNSKGRPELQFFQQGLILIEQFGIAASQLSLTDEGEYAQAFVILEGQQHV